jgi:hypothetical protein
VSLSEKDGTYMLMTWHTVALEKEQLQVTAFSNPFRLSSLTHPYSPLHGSTLKFQSVFPKLFAMSRKASTAKVYDQIRNKRKGYPDPTNQICTFFYYFSDEKIAYIYIYRHETKIY